MRNLRLVQPGSPYKANVGGSIPSAPTNKSLNLGDIIVLRRQVAVKGLTILTPAIIWPAFRSSL
jgi:hypothetical protein